MGFRNCDAVTTRRSERAPVLCGSAEKLKSGRDAFRLHGITADRAGDACDGVAVDVIPADIEIADRLAVLTQFHGGRHVARGEIPVHGAGHLEVFGPLDALEV